MNLQIDSHQHFWKLERGDYHWLTADSGALYQDFLPGHLEPLLVDNGIVKTVLVQAASSDQETDFMLSLAEQCDFIAGVVGWVDMESACAVERIQALAESPWIKGIRPMIQDIEDTDWMLKPGLDRAFQALVDCNLSFDALVLTRHLPNLLTLLKRYPELRGVVNHGAKPDIAGGDTEQWRDHIAALANQTQACCKFSGLVTEAGERADYKHLKPYFRHLYRCFGAERLMWGSDWPVVKLSMEYDQWRKLALDLLAQLPANDQQQLLGGTAARFYRIEGAC